MEDRTVEEAKAHYISKMGELLGEQFYALWLEVALLHLNWKEYVELFGTNERRVKRLNESAPAFFRMIQDQLWTATVLHIARLLDAPKSVGKPNLTVRNLTDLVNPELQMPLAELIDIAVKNAAFARDWRNRVIAHTDLSLALKDGTVAPLEEASRATVNSALASIADVLNKVDYYYADSGTLFTEGARRTGAVTLLYLLGDGLKAKAEREERELKTFQVEPLEQI